LFARRPGGRPSAAQCHTGGPAAVHYQAVRKVCLRQNPQRASPRGARPARTGCRVSRTGFLGKPKTFCPINGEKEEEKAPMAVRASSSRGRLGREHGRVVPVRQDSGAWTGAPTGRRVRAGLARFKRALEGPSGQARCWKTAPSRPHPGVEHPQADTRLFCQRAYDAAQNSRHGAAVHRKVRRTRTSRIQALRGGTGWRNIGIMETHKPSSRGGGCCHENTRTRNHTARKDGVRS